MIIRRSIWAYIVSSNTAPDLSTTILYIYALIEKVVDTQIKTAGPAHY